MASATRKLVYLAVYLLCAAVSTTYASDKPCTVHAKGRYFDLNPLKARSTQDYNVLDITIDRERIFPINVCQSVRTETFGVKDSTIADEEVAAFIRRAHGDFVIGKVNTTLGIYENRPRLVLSGGSECKSASGEALDIRASTVVDFICDAGIFGPGQPRLVAQLPPGGEDEACAFVIEWKTHYACPISESGVVWTIFVFLAAVFLAVLTAYTVLGTLYNRYVLQLRGFDQIPQFSIESMKYHSSEAIDWLKDIAAGLDIPGGQHASRFRSSSNNQRTTNPFSHQAQSGGIPNRDEDDEASIGFSRPFPSGKKPEINPVSHQSQVIAEAQRSGGGSLSFAAVSAPSPIPVAVAPTPPPKLMTIIPVRTKLEVREATPAERQYMLGDEDEEDEDGEEEDDEDEEEDEEDEEQETPRKETPSQGPLPSTQSQGPSSSHPPGKQPTGHS